MSLVSGVYEEIPDLPTPPREFQNDRQPPIHHYEDPVELILGTPGRPGHCFPPPPLPPRQDAMRKYSFSTQSADEGVDLVGLSPPQSPKPIKPKKIPFYIGSESEYMDMTPSDCIYTPMRASIKEENTYMIMNGKKD